MVKRNEKLMTYIEAVLGNIGRQKGGLEKLTHLSCGAITSIPQAINLIREGDPVGNALYDLFETIYRENQPHI